METLLALLGFACRLIGLAEWFEGMLTKRAAAKQEQAIADAPTTREELDERLEDHNF